MEWCFTKDRDGIPVGNFGCQDPYQNGLDRYLTNLLSERVAKDFPLSKSPKLASTFLNDFLKFKGHYPANNFRTPGWVYSTDRMRWSRMISFMLTNFKATLKDIGLYGAIRNVQYDYSHSAYHLFSILEIYTLSLECSLLLLVNSALLSMICSKSLYYRWWSCCIRR